ncbi:ATP-dependent RNA helicase DBP5 [Histomonas meleagridis]|uniref:ATP-dependent RNA helicase DBP5 n=1 Tax=Histomonas meleagridis TaxID=135588 RepID=UPI00355A871B|nr:ATP-dependent RNA helicase DBP5 [Histomonas meleagridis]KAH0797653.1 ATP-dependent RNA helicase DBP5 [Histomonas meleagridis]
MEEGSAEFSDFIKNGDIIQGLADMGIVDPSEIQVKALPLIVSGKNVLANAPCGCGKTIAFLAGIMNIIDKNLKDIQAIYLAPTRELVKQTRDVFDPINKYIELTSGVSVGTDSIVVGNPQFIFGTPGSIQKLYKDRKGFPKCKFLVIDEADELITAKSHRGSTKFLIEQLKKQKCQFGFFSATFSPNTTKFLSTIAGDVIEVKITPKESKVQHWYVMLNQGTKEEQHKEATDALLELNKHIPTGQIYIFANRRDEVEAIAEDLNKGGFECRAFSGKLTPGERDSVIQDFRKEKIKVLVATDVLQRGIDIPNTYLVVNWGFPSCKGVGTNISDSYSYIHRSGRAGRFGRPGICLSIIFNEEQEKALKNVIEKRPDITELKKIDWHHFEELPKEESLNQEENHEE